LSDLVLTVEDENRCTFSDTINIGFNPLPEVNLGNDQTLCTNTPLTLAGGAGDSYLWNTGESTGTIAAVESGKYWLTIQKDGCANTDSVNIRIYNPDRFSVNATEIHDVTCFGSGNGSLLVLADGPAGSFLYSVDGGDSLIDNNGRFENLMPSDDYRIQVLADSVCRISAPGPVTISEPDEIRVRHRVRLAGCKECSDGIIELTEITGGTPPFEIAWDNMQSGPIAEGLTPGEYQAVITDANGCAKTVSYEIVVQTDVPNAFTPNGDGVNDRWFIRFLDFYPEAVVKVFDSFGKIVFIRENGYTEPWDGTSGGQPLPMGAYYYYIYLTPRDIPLKGSLTLIR
jgi:gliding motility-associated-like protein